MIVNNRLKRVVSSILLFVMILGFITSNSLSVYGADTNANFMNAKMINFFQKSNESIEMSEISEGELSVYGVFLSNFLTPMETRLDDLSTNNENDNKIAQQISKIFFGSEGNQEKVGELNELIYKASLVSVKNNQLTNSEDAVVTGEGFLNAMISDGDNSKLYFNGQLAVDFKEDSFRGAFKILAAQSAGIIFDENYGIAGMSSFYIDCFGNIWGAFPITRTVGETTDESETPKEKLHLVLPACLNPAAFLNTTNNKSLSETKVPLNNAFAMGSIIESDNISSKFSEDALVPYYNIPAYLTGSDRDNALFIYGINTPFDFINNTDDISGNVNVDSKLNEYFSSNYNNADNYKIVMSNRLDVMKNSLSSKENWFKKDTRRLQIIEYLYGSLVVDLDETYSDIFYFGDSGNASWSNSTFEDLGMTGVNIFGKQQADGKWQIHDNNQKATKVTELMESSRNTVGTSPYKIRENLGVLVDDNWFLENILKMDISTLNTSGLTFISEDVVQPIDTSKFNIFSGSKYYIHNVSATGDSKLNDKLVELIESGTFLNTWVDWYTKVVNPMVGGVFNSKSTFNVFGENTIEEEALFHNLHTYSISGGKLVAVKDRKDNIEVVKTDGDISNLTITNSRISSEANWPGIFWGYMVEMFDMVEMVKYDENGIPNYQIRNFDSIYLPKLPSGIVTGQTLSLNPLSTESGVANSADLTMEEMQKDLIKKIYGIVSNKPNEYRDSWIKTTLDGFLINTHKAITGSWVGNIATVSSENNTSYASVVGYIHTPSLYDLPFTSWIMNNYMQMYILALLVVLILCILMVLLNMRSWRQGVVIFSIMTVALMLPNVLIENTINIGNKAADTIYSDRFDFWALSQHQHSILKLKGAGDVNSLEYLLTSTGEQAKNVYSQESGVRIKWMAPKKSGVFTNLFSNKYASDKLVENLNLFKLFFSSFVYQQEFVSNDPFATYLYRPYNAIATDVYEYYNAASNNSGFIEESKKRNTITVQMENKENEVRSESVEVPKFIEYINQKSQTEHIEGLKDRLYGSSVWGTKELLRKDNVFNIYWSEEKYTDIVETVSQYPSTASIEKKSVSLWGLGNEQITDVILSEGVLGNKSGPDIPKTTDKITPTNSIDEINAVGFYKNTESPFYYFYNTLKYRYGGNSFRNSLLDSEVFLVRDGELQSSTRNVNNSVRDFLDLEGLFTNIIPYMSMSNEYVYGWTSVYGTEIPDYDFQKSEAQSGMDVDTQATYSELKELKTGMEKVWNMYSPWVDQLNSLDIHNEKVGIGGKKVRIENTLNPSYYLKVGRPMIFSEADMIAKGYNSSDLSDVERRIQAVLDTTYRDLQYLVNYYDMDDEVLITAAAMYATFNFNREFSQNSIFGDTVMLYPQGFEMKNFNYDAFMRLVLLNSTGETIFSEDGDLYNRVLSKTSFFTGLLLLITDILGVIIIPTMKLLILIMLLFLGILLCITCVVCPPEKLLEAISKSLLIPAMLFMVSNIIFALLVSFLVGEGLTTYVGSRGISITTNDPTITIALLIIINGAYCVALFKIIKLLFSKYKSFGISTLQAGLGIIGGVGLAGLSNLKKAASKTGSTVGGAVVGTAMADKGNRIKGGIDGASIGARGGSVYNQRRNEQRLAESTGGKGIIDDINMKASGNGKAETKSKPDKLDKMIYENDSDGTTVGNALSKGVYKVNATRDQMHQAKTSLTKGIKNIKQSPKNAKNYVVKTREQYDNAVVKYGMERAQRADARNQVLNSGDEFAGYRKSEVEKEVDKISRREAKRVLRKGRFASVNNKEKLLSEQQSKDNNKKDTKDTKDYPKRNNNKSR